MSAHSRLVRPASLAVEPLEDRLAPAVFTVTDLADTGIGRGTRGDLRYCITQAEADPDPDTITFDQALVSGRDATISLQSFDTGLDDGEAGPTAFIIRTPISIVAPDSDHGITIARGATSPFRLFHVQPIGRLVLANVTLSNGLAQGFHGGDAMFQGAGGGSAGLGGAILNQGTLVLQRSTLSGNRAVGGAGGYSYGGVPEVFALGGGAGLGADGGTSFGHVFIPIIFPANGGGPNGGDLPSASGGFGGGGASGGGSLYWPYGYSLTGGAGGFGGGGGGGVGTAAGGAGGFGGGGGGGGWDQGPGGFGGGTADYNIAGGGAGMGGGIFNLDGTAAIVNSTLADNSVIGGRNEYADGDGFDHVIDGLGLGGALFSRNGSVSVVASTLSGNTASDGGGGIFVVGDGEPATVTVVNSILADTAGGETDFDSAAINGGRRIFSGSGNLIEVNAHRRNGFTGGIVSTADPALLPLGDYGGPTPTFALRAGSPAIDAGDDLARLATDQRGYPRPSGTAMDIGAFEVNDRRIQGKDAYYGHGRVNAGEAVKLAQRHDRHQHGHHSHNGHGRAHDSYSYGGRSHSFGVAAYSTSLPALTIEWSRPPHCTGSTYPSGSSGGPMPRPTHYSASPSTRSGRTT